MHPVYDRRERLNRLMFRSWRLMQPISKTAASPRSAYLLSAAGVVLAFVGISLATVAWPAAIVAVAGLYATVGYGMVGYARRAGFRLAAGHDWNIKPRDFLNAPRSPDEDYRLVRPKDGTWAQLYPYVDLSHHDIFIQGENELTRKQRYELYERWYGLCPNGFMHLEKRAGDDWRPISVSIMLPLSGAGYRAITARSEPHRLSVVDLDRDEILPGVTSRNPFLLIDTWIVDREGGFGGAGHGKTSGRGGNANLLVLRHLSLFWTPTSRLKHLSILVETGNKWLIPALEVLSFRQSGASNIDEAFYLTSPMQFKAITPEGFAQLKAAMAEIVSVEVTTGTAPVPKGWYYRHE